MTFEDRAELEDMRRQADQLRADLENERTGRRIDKQVHDAVLEAARKMHTDLVAAQAESKRRIEFHERDRATLLEVSQQRDAARAEVEGLQFTIKLNSYDEKGTHISEWRSRAHQAEAAAAAMREALERCADAIAQHERYWNETLPRSGVIIAEAREFRAALTGALRAARAALASDAGKPLLERLARLERLSDLQDKLLACHRLGKQPGKWLEEMPVLRAALARDGGES